MSAIPTPKSMITESRAPFVFFEHVSAMSCTNGVYCLSLAAGRPLAMTDGSLLNELVTVGQLQGTRQALTELRLSIDRILNLDLSITPAAPRAADKATSDEDDSAWRH